VHSIAIAVPVGLFTGHSTVQEAVDCGCAGNTHPVCTCSAESLLVPRGFVHDGTSVSLEYTGELFTLDSMLDRYPQGLPAPLGVKVCCRDCGCSCMVLIEKGCKVHAAALCYVSI
jgi:hypothetical protein